MTETPYAWDRPRQFPPGYRLILDYACHLMRFGVSKYFPGLIGLNPAVELAILDEMERVDLALWQHERPRPIPAYPARGLWW